MTVGEKIKMYRLAKGMTQQDVANVLGVSYQNISQYERGVRTPKMSMVRRIASALSVNAWDIAGVDPSVEVDVTDYVPLEEAFTKEKRRNELVANFNRLNIAGQLKAVDAVADLAEVPKYRKEGGE